MKNLKQILAESTSVDAVLAHESIRAAIQKELDALAKKPNKQVKKPNFTIDDAVKFLNYGKLPGENYNKILQKSDGIFLTDSDIFINFKNKNTESVNVFDPSELIYNKIAIDLEKCEKCEISADILETFELLDFPSDETTVVSYDDDLKLLRECASSEEIRCYLNGVYFNIYSQQMVSTNGHIMAIKPVVINNNGGFASPVIPNRFVELLIKLGLNEIKFNEKWVFAESESIAIKAKVIDGSYPDYKRVIPADSNLILNLAIDPQIKKIKNAGKKEAHIFLNDAGESVVVIKSGKIIEFGEKTDDLKPIICFSLGYLLTAANGESTIKIAVKTQNNRFSKCPAIINESVILMPLSVKQ